MQAITAGLLVLVAGYRLFDALQTVTINTLRGGSARSLDVDSISDAFYLCRGGVHFLGTLRDFVALVALRMGR